MGSCIGNVRSEWKKWINEGLVYQYQLPQPLDGTEDFSSPYKGYLTDEHTGTPTNKRNFNPETGTWGGLYDISQFKSYALSSAHPEARFLQTGGDRLHRPAASQRR